MEGLYAGTMMAALMQRIEEELGNKKKEREKQDLSFIDKMVGDLSDILDKIKEVDEALEATTKLKKLHEQGKPDLTNPIHLALFETAKFDPEDYDPDGGISQFTEHTETLEEAKRRLVDKANEIANSDDPDLVKDERFQELKEKFEHLINIVDTIFGSTRIGNTNQEFFKSRTCCECYNHIINI